MKSFLDWLNKVFGNTTTTPEQPAGEPEVWLRIAKGELGVHETRGGETARILEYHAASTGKFREDEVAWCKSFTNWVLKKAGYKTDVGPNDALAVSGLGKPYIKLAGPKIGCLVIFEWASGGHHIAFCIDFDDDKVKVLGGNQSDLEFGSGGAVNEKWQSRKYVMGYTWPVKL